MSVCHSDRTKEELHILISTSCLICNQTFAKQDLPNKVKVKIFSFKFHLTARIRMDEYMCDKTN
jgi:hypothetical protein